MTEIDRDRSESPRGPDSALTWQPLGGTSGTRISGGRIEHEEEARARLAREEREHASQLSQREKDQEMHRRLRFWGSVTCMVGVFALGIACLVILCNSNDPDMRKWAATAISSIAAGAISFMAGRGSKRGEE